MTVVQKQIGILFLLVSPLAAQMANAPANLQDVRITRDGTDVRVDIVLSAPAKPSITTAVHPDRLVVELPSTTSNTRERRIDVHYHGVRSVRYGLHRTDPPTSRVVVELDQALAHSLSGSATHIVIKISPPAGLAAERRRSVPAAAASSGLVGIFHKRQETPPPPTPTESAQIPTPPPSGPPIPFPGTQPGTNGQTTTASASPRPTAAHPNRGSLQEGTVFPGMGSPGAGVVPPVTGTNTGSFDPEKTKTESATSNLESMQGNINSGSGTQSKGAEIGSSIPTSTSAPAEEKPAVTEVRVEEPASPPQSTAPVAQDSSALPSGGPVKTSAPQSTDNAQFAALPESTSLEEKSDSQKEAHDSSENELDQQVQALRAANPNLRTVFKVKYVAEGVAYLDGGRADGLSEGMKLEIKDNEIAPRLGEVADPSDPRVVAELEVNGVAEMSAVTDIHSPKRRVTPGDLAYLSTTDLQTLVQQHALSTTRKYPAVVTFTEGDPLEEEARAEVPKPPLPSVNRARGRIGLDYIGTSSAGVTSSSLGVVLRADITRLNGTYWNISGYWRGRLQSTAPSGQQTIQDLINRTYHLSMTYDNPGSNWVAGFGRLYLPWAPSLETIDGGYFGRRFSSGVTGGIFAGSTPDPTSYSYNPDQEIAGAFINFDGGSYDDWKYTSTSGVGVSALHFAVDRPFVFFENGIFYKRYLSIYDSLQADSPKGNQAVAAPGPGLSRNFLTVRIQPHPRVELDFNHNYFRDVPTFDPTLIGTGLLDKYLFQGFSAGTRVQVFRQIFAYTELGSSNRTGDAKSSLNQTYGITFNRLPWFGIRADAHYSRFNSSFGDGSYKAVTFSRNMSENLRLEVLLGQQDFVSGIATSGRSRFVNANIESTLGSHYFVQGGFGMNRGDLNYTQWMFTLGYRFDNRSKHE